MAIPKQLQKNLHVYSINKEDYKFTQKILLTSDWHFDNPKTKRKLLFEHLNQVVKENAYIIVNGDTLCLMQGKYDPRGTKSSIRKEHSEDSYLDIVIEDTAQKILPYAKNILQINEGNHESSVSKRAETNVLKRLVERINQLAGTKIQLGRYTGLIVLDFSYKGASRKPLKIAYSHGNWGGMITKGTLSVVRYSSMFPDADVVISSHTHDGWIMSQPRFIYNPYQKTYKIKNQWHVKTGTYKEEFEGGSGWAVERIAMPKYLGSCWMKVNYEQKKDLTFTFELTY